MSNGATTIYLSKTTKERLQNAKARIAESMSFDEFINRLLDQTEK